VQRVKALIATVLVLLVLCLECSSAQAQADASSIGKGLHKEKSLFSVAAGYQRGFIFAHSEAVQNTRGSHPSGAELVLGWQRNDKAVWDQCNCYPRKGVLLAYYDYDNAILGSSINAAYFLEPAYRLNDKLLFSIKGAAGLSYLTHPFDSIKNPGNQSYSTNLSAYLLVGAGFWVRLNRQWWLNASANYQHVSNGGLREPNKGINWPTAGLALSYQKTSRPFYTSVRTKEKFWKDHALRWNATLFGMARRSPHDGGGRQLPLVGVAVQASKQVGRINALNLGLEVYRDEKLRVQLKKDSIEASSVKAGLLAGHTFLLGRFLFSQHLGIYLFDQTPYHDLLYHRWGVQYALSRNTGTGFSLQAHRQVAEFVDLRFTYTFQHYTSKAH
jgi:hypothetical protein